MNTICNGASFSFLIQEEKIKDLESLLSVMKLNPEENGIFSMGKSKTAHYATWVIVPEEVRPIENWPYDEESIREIVKKKTMPAHLLLLTTYCGKKNEHIKEFSALQPEGLHKLFSCCKNYSASNVSTKSLFDFLKSHCVANTVFNAFQFTTVDDIRNEESLCDEIQNFLDQEEVNFSSQNSSAKQIREKIQKHIESKAEFQWALKPSKINFADRWSYQGPWIMLRVIAVLIVLVSVFGFFNHNIVSTVALWILLGAVLLMALMFLTFRFNETRVAVQANHFVDRRPDTQLKKISDQENQFVCNEMTVTGPLKQGFIRPIWLRFLLTFARIRRPFLFIPTVHTARWLQIDNGRRLIFAAYFDNTSDGYAHDFVDSDRRTRKVNLVLGNGNGYPPTRWAVLDGGKDANGYMTTVRNQQKLTNVWYSTHKRSSILNVLTNQQIRRGLAGEMNEAQAKKWLQYF